MDQKSSWNKNRKKADGFRFLIAAVAAAEYIAVVHAGRMIPGGACRQGMFLCGYILLVWILICNYHGRGVSLAYEQGLSFLVKCMLADVLQTVFLLSAGDMRAVLRTMVILAAVQAGSILALCRVNGLRKGNRREERLLYIYEGSRCSRQGMQADAFGGRYRCREYLELPAEVDWEAVQEEIQKHDVIYIYDVSSKVRNDLLKYCFGVGKQVFLTAKLSDMLLRSAGITQDYDRPLLACDCRRMPAGVEALKRLFDIIFAAFFLAVLSPLFAVTAIRIRREDGGPVFYRQTRCTRDMKEFEIIKFRSMVVGAEEETGAQLSEDGDGRLTRVGRSLRRWKLDELPQLYNILKGEMSFVGPRPERPELIAQAIGDVPEFILRTRVRAGLTGYAQVRGSYGTDFLDKLKWDLMYIENYSLFLDLKIIFMTIPAILRKQV